MLPDKLLVNLKILSKIPKMGRISRGQDGFISLENELFYLPVKRFVYNDGRKQTLNEINNIINESINFVRTIFESKYMNVMYNQSEEFRKNCELLILMNDAMQQVIPGLDNLKVTYQDDPNVLSQIDIVILKICTCVKDISGKLKEYDTNSKQD
jgi:hypothetical protein